MLVCSYHIVTDRVVIILNHNYEEKLQMAFRYCLRIGNVILHL
jgi:hypothetical protein